MVSDLSKTVIIDYGAGNLRSIANMLDYLNTDYKISDSISDIKNAGRLIFPGQGHFKQAMENLERKSLIELINTQIKEGKQFLGICLGLQVLFEQSEEAPNVPGMGILKGAVKKFNARVIDKTGVETICKTPQIGWNSIKTTTNNSFLKDDFYYFVNSYYVEPADKSVVSSVCDYNGEFCASIEKDNLTAVQFHPEKSSETGLSFFKSWLKLR